MSTRQPAAPRRRSRASSVAGGDVHDAAARARRRATRRSRAGDVVLAEHLDHPLGRAVALVDQRRPGCRRRSQRADVGDRALDVAAVGLDRRGPAAPALDGAGLDVDVDARRSRRARRAAASPVAGVGVEAERADAPPGLALREARARGRRRASGTTPRRGRSAPVPPPAAAAQRRLEELLAGRDQVVGAAAGPLGVEHQHVGVGRASGRRAAPSRRRAPGPATPCPRRRCPSAILSVSSASCGCALAELGGPAAHLVGEQQLAARRRPQPVDRARGCAGRRPRSERISSTSSPQNSTRSGCSSVGGKTSTMPPRTANSPRFSTRSTREYAAPARAPGSPVGCARSRAGSRAALLLGLAHGRALLLGAGRLELLLHEPAVGGARAAGPAGCRM